MIIILNYMLQVRNVEHNLYSIKVVIFNFWAKGICMFQTMFAVHLKKKTKIM